MSDIGESEISIGNRRSRTNLETMGTAAPAPATRCIGGSRLRHVVLTLALASATLLTALALPDIDVVFSLLGGTCSAFVCYIIPSAVAYQLADRVPQNRTLLGRIAVFGLGFFGLLVGFLSTTTTIVGLVDRKANNTTFDACNPENS